ncbi:MAG TPA: discoidin domain-containing protein, partial [Pseudonocardiaceae bacterium]|nr:discoidin domain-containing protein [Pseudonocardiaceae bacterium]
MGRPRPATLAMLSAVAVILPVTVFLATATAGTDATIQQACGTDSAFLWNSDQDFGARDIQLEPEEPYGAQGVIYPSHAGDGGADNHRIQGGVYTLDGDRVRTYYDTYRVKTVTEARLVFRARKDSATDNISVKFGNHSLDGWVFGGYGISFHDGEVQSKVEYYHNDHGTEESDSLTRSLGDGVWYWFRIDLRSTGAGEKVLDAYVDYDGTDDTTQQWTPVMTGRTWTDGDWDPPSVPSGGQDSDEVADGVYLGPLNRVWIRGNGGGEVDYHRVTLCELGTSPGPTTTTTTTTSPTLTSTTSTPPPSGPVKLPVVAVTASEHDGNVPANAVDGNLGTRWSAEGDPEWIRFQLGAVSDVSSVKIAWYRGDTRRASFDVETSNDGSSWTGVFSGGSSGTTVAFETYDVVDSRSAYVRIVGHGNDANAWNSISEVELWGGSGSPT